MRLGAGRIPFFVAAGAALATGLLLYAGYPPLEWWWSSWIALIPMLVLAPELGRFRSVFWFGLAGFLSASLGLSWIYRLAPPGGVLVSGWLALFVAVFGLGARTFLRYSSPVGPWLTASLWVALELLRSRLLGGFPWLFLGHTQVDLLTLIQVADLAGVYGVSFVTVWTSAYLAQVLRVRLGGSQASDGRSLFVGALFSGGLIVGCLVYGAVRLALVEEQDGPRVAAIQADIDVLGKTGGMTGDEIVMLHHRLSLQAAKETPEPSLIVWSETMVPTLTPERAEILESMRSLVDVYDAGFLFGVEARERSAEGSIKRFNRAVYIRRDRSIETYDKVQLVPFGEYMPIPKGFPFRPKLEEIMLDAMGLIPDMTPGERTPLFTLDGRDGRTYRFGAMICYDSVFARLARRFDREAVDFLVNLSNDGWYEGTAQPRQILDITRFRAVENRVGIVRVANRGISAIISPVGGVEILHRFEPGGLATPQSQCGTVPVTTARSLYSSIGDLFAWICAAVVAMGLLIPVARQNRAG